MTYPFEQFRAELDARCPIHRAKAIVGAINALPIGTRVGGYVREPGRDRWRCDYTSTKRRRDVSTETVNYRSYTGPWSLALDVGFPTKHKAKEAEAIARIAHRVMVEQGATTLPPIDPIDAPVIIAEPVFLPPPPPPLAPIEPAAPKRCQLAFAF